MGLTLAEKILQDHLLSGELAPGKEIGIRIDQTLTQDATGTMAYLQFEAMAIPRVKTKLSVSYVDHNTLQSDFRNADDHKFLRTIAAKKGVFFSRPGNGICHQVHLERFGVPGQTLLGSDSHTPTCGGIGMIAIGAGGLDVAVAMGGGPFYLPTPDIVKVELTGKLKPWVSAKDIILEVLRRLTVKGGVGKIIEYAGPGVKTLTVPERATITNMGAELGATCSIFPSDNQTRTFLKAQNRLKHFKPLEADPDARYADVVSINLDKLVPMVACPHSPDLVVPAAKLSTTAVDQVCIGSCTNSSYTDLTMVGNILKGKTVHPDVSLTISPGSRQVLNMITKNGALTNIIAAGARILENACGPCIGMGQAPPTAGVSARTFNRNFPGRSGTADGQVYLMSPETAAASALKGKITDPRRLGVQFRRPAMPKTFLVDDRMVIPPAKSPDKIEVYRGPNIKALPAREPLPETIAGRVLIKLGDNITTDDIMPAGAKVLPLRSNIPAISEFVFHGVDPEFVTRAKQEKGGIIVGGANYGQGSSREHAALAPMYLGVRFVLSKSFARIHRANLVNFGILPLQLANAADYEHLHQGDDLAIENAPWALKPDQDIIVKNRTRGIEIRAHHSLSQRQIDVIKAGGLLNYTRQQA